METPTYTVVLESASETTAPVKMSSTVRQCAPLVACSLASELGLLKLPENTLRWIYSAQKQQQPQATEDDTMDSEPTVEPEVVDPRQQTLHQFFKAPQQSSTFRPSRQALAPRANETALAEEETRYRAFNQMNGAGSSSASESNSPGYTQMGADVDMDMDMDTDCASGSDASNQMPNNWMGRTAWM